MRRQDGPKRVQESLGADLTPTPLVFCSDPAVPMPRQIGQIFLVRLAGCGAIAVEPETGWGWSPRRQRYRYRGPGGASHLTKKLRRRARNVVSRRRLSLGPWNPQRQEDSRPQAEQMW